jgi:hypothetical protein
MAIQDTALSVTVAADGTAVQRIQTDNRFQTWTVTQVSVEMPAAPIGATCWLRKDGAPVTPLIATGDAASGEPPITLRPGQTLTVEWAGCTPGDVGQVWMSYDDGVQS